MTVEMMTKRTRELGIEILLNIVILSYCLIGYFSGNLHLLGESCLNTCLILQHRRFLLQFITNFILDKHMYHDYFQVTGLQVRQATITFSPINIIFVAN